MWNLVGVCLGTLVLVLASIAICLLRLLPSFWRLARRALRALLILSFRLYDLALTCLAPILQRFLNIDLMAGWPRMVACMCLSLVLGLLFLWLTKITVTVWSVGLCLLHGVTVGLAWDEFEEPGGIRLGMRLQ